MLWIGICIRVKSMEYVNNVYIRIDSNPARAVSHSNHLAACRKYKFLLNARRNEKMVY